jgi:hypothetical protein
LAPTTNNDLVLYMIGDVPYNQAEAIKLQRDLLALPRDAHMVVHVGGVNSAKHGCQARRFQHVRGIFKFSPVPVLALPGDNDWNDCYSVADLHRISSRRNPPPIGINSPVL